MYILQSGYQHDHIPHPAILASLTHHDDQLTSRSIQVRKGLCIRLATMHKASKHTPTSPICQYMGFGCILHHVLQHNLSPTLPGCHRPSTQVKHKQGSKITTLLSCDTPSGPVRGKPNAIQSCFKPVCHHVRST